MSNGLYRLGKWIFNHRKRVIVSVLAILVLFAAIGIAMGPKFDDNMSLSGTESAKANKLLEKEFPATQTDGGQIQVVMKAPKGSTLDSKESTAAINKMLQKIKKDSKVKTVVPPAMLKNYSKDRRIGYAVVVYKVKADNVSEHSKSLVKKAIKITKKEGIQTELTGTVKISKMDTGETSEIYGIIIALFVLAVTFASFIVAGLPIISAILGLLVGLMGVLILSHYMSVASFSLSLCAMLGLAVGIDYALFIISRYRQEFAQTGDIKESSH